MTYKRYIYFLARHSYWWSRRCASGVWKAHKRKCEQNGLFSAFCPTMHVPEAGTLTVLCHFFFYKKNRASKHDEIRPFLSDPSLVLPCLQVVTWICKKRKHEFLWHIYLCKLLPCLGLFLWRQGSRLACVVVNQDGGTKTERVGGTIHGQQINSKPQTARIWPQDRIDLSGCWSWKHRNKSMWSFDVRFRCSSARKQGYAPSFICNLSWHFKY